MALPAIKHLDPVVGVDVHAVLIAPSPTPVFLPHPHVGFVLDLREYVSAAMGVIGSIVFTFVEDQATEYLEAHPDVEAQIAKGLDSVVDDLGKVQAEVMSDAVAAEAIELAGEGMTIAGEAASAMNAGVGMGATTGRPVFVNGFLRATAGTHAFHLEGLHFPLGESFAPPDNKPMPSNDAESYMGSRTVLANNDPMSFMALPAMSCWAVGLEPPPHNGVHTERTYPSMPSSVMLPIPVGRPVLVGGPPVMNMAALAMGLFKAFRGSKWAEKLADKLKLKPGFLRCTVLGADPVNMITGEVVMQQHDFTVSGRLPLVWNRHYSSHDSRRGAVGVGWQTPADIRLELMRHAGAVGVVAYFPDHATAFDAMPAADGWAARVYDWQHGHALYRQDDRLVLRTRAGIEYGYALPAQWQYALEELVDATGLTLPVGRMADLNGNAWVFERGPDSSLTRSVEWKGEEVTGRTVECEASRGNRVESHKRLLTALTLIDADGRAHPLVGYEYDRDGNLIAALDAMSQPHHFEYDDAHRMVRHTSARGVSFYYNHQRYDDEVWRVDRAWGDNGLLAYRFVYDPVRQETHITDSLGHTTLLQYNERGIPVAQIDPLGGVTTYRYDAQWRTSAETDPAGRTTMWAYDAYGNLLAQTLPDGSALRAAEHNVDHKLVRVADTSGRQRRYTWDERRNLLGELPPTQASSQYCYDAHGQVVSHTGPCGAVTRFLYDHDGNLAEVIDAVGHRTRYTHDARANLIQTVNALGQMSQYEYDRNGNLTRAIEPGGSEFFCSYDADGNLTRYRDPNGRVTQLEYSPLGQITRRLTPDGNAVEYRYDTEGQLIAVVNERGELYQLKRDALGRIVEEIDYWGQPRRYVYGAEGELLRSIDPLGQAIDYDTDVLGRIVKKRVPDLRQPDGIRTETFSYDPHGNLIVAENPDCRVELKYDSTGRVVEERQGDDFVIVHVYNAVGNRIERRTELKAGGEIITHTVRYEYDALDVVSSIQIDDAAPVTFDRNALGQIRVEHLGEELRRELSYTSEGLLAKQSLLAGTGPLFVSDYAYNANEEMTEKRDWRLGCARYEYNPVGKLITHLDPAGKLHRFLYDPAGDLLKTWIRQGHPYDREPQTDTWIREGDYEGCRYAFDRVGNLVRKQDQQQDLMLSWDGDGLLIETLTVRQVRGGEECSSGTLSIHTRYGYDAFHRRTKKITTILQETDSQTRSNSEWTAPSRTSCFFWDAAVLAGEFRRGDRYADRLLDCSSGAGMARSNTFISPTGLTNVRSQSPDEYGEARAWFYYPGSFVPLAGMRHACAPASPVGDVLAFGHVINDEGTSAIKRPQVPHEDRDDRALFAIRLPSDPTSEPSTLSYFHTDPNGTPMRITDSQGAVMWESIYEAWGNCVHIEIGIRFDQPLRSLGQYFDTESGLHYNLFRYFDPKAAQFINQDPIGIIGGCNVYQYAHNFIGWVDPLGLSGKRNRNSPPPFNPGDLRSINRWLVRAAQRGLREGGDNWQKAQNMFVKYAIRINERLIQAGSDYRLRYELAVNSAGEQVKPSETGSRRLEIVVENTKTGKYVSGVDVSLNPKKEEKIKEKLIKEGVLTEEDELMSVNSYYREFFEKQWPGFKVFDIRSMYMDHCTRTRKIVPGWMAEED